MVPWQALTPSDLPVMEQCWRLARCCALASHPRGQSYAARWPVWSSLPIDSWRAGLLAASAHRRPAHCCGGAVEHAQLIRRHQCVRQERAGTSKQAVVAFAPASLIEGSDPARAYFADGMTQDVINALGRFPSWTVMSWNAVCPTRERPCVAAEIAQGPGGARYYIEGSIRQADGRVRATAQLADAPGSRPCGPAVLTRRSPICLPCRTR